VVVIRKNENYFYFYDFENIITNGVIYFIVKRDINSNLWKYFVFILTSRRNYIPILSLYFLSLPNTAANQIGIYTGIAWLAGFFLEIPSGYLSDKFGHKKTLILAKFSIIISTLLFSFGSSLYYFIFGSIFLSIGVAFISGTQGAFLHNTLIELKRSKEYAVLSGKMASKASLVSVGMILALPLLTKISLVMPIKAFLIFDVIGIFVAFSFYSPKIKFSAEDEEGERIWSQLKRFKGSGFYTMSLFFGLIGSFLISLSPFKEVYVESLGIPIIFIGFIMAFSRVVWFVVGHNLKFLKKLKFKQLLFYEIFFFPILIIISSQLKNPYIVGSIIAIILGYYHARKPIIVEYYLNNFLINKRYKATMISIKQQMAQLIQSVIAFLIGYVMVISFSLGFLVIGVFMLVLLLITYFFMRKYF
jgi:MFS family permease